MPLVAFLPALITAGGALGAAALSRRGGSSSSSSSSIDRQQQSLIDIQRRLADYGIPAGKANFEKASGAYDTSLDFYKKILGGSSEDILKLLNADEYTKSADEAQGIAYNLSGRGGGRAAVLSGVSESRAANLNRIITQLRTGAAGEISNIGQAIANMGAQQLSAGAGGLTSASNILFGLNQIKQQESDRRAQLIASIIGTAGTVAGAIYANRGSNG